MSQRSKGCSICRQRKVKCDEQVPECLQCRQARRPCPGPTVGNIFLTARPGKKKRHALVDETSFRGIITDANRPDEVSDNGNAAFPYLREADRVSHFPPPANSIVMPEIVELGHLGPYSSLPVKVDAASRMLMDLYFTHFPRKFGLTGLPSIWFPFAVADTILFEATLYVAAYHHADLHGDRENTLSIAHKGKMLRLINHRLGDPKAGLANGTLCAVALLTGCEAIHGSIENWNIHITGLQRMMTLRGGFESGHMPSRLLRMLFAAYSYGAVRSTFDPHLKIKTELEEALLSSNPGIITIEFRGSPTNTTKLRDMVVASGFTQDLLLCFQSLQNFVISAEYYHSRLNTDSEYDIFEGTLTVIEYMLASSRRPSVLSANPGARSHLQEAARLAGFLFVSIFIRKLPPLVLVHVELMGQMKSLLEGEVLDSLQGSTAAVTLWVMFMGAIVAVNRPERPWFLERIYKLLREGRMRRWEEVESSLEQIVWSRLLTAVPTRLLHEEISTMLAKMGQTETQRVGEIFVP